MACNLPNKVNPTFIGVKQAPLSCEEYDNNLRILLQRSNHEGSQSYVTICDFNEGIELSQSYNDLESQITANTAAILNIENLLGTGGSINNDLTNSEARLQSQINDVVSVNNTQNTRLSNAETSLTQLLNFINDLGDLDLGPIGVRVTNLETSTANLTNSISQLTTQQTTLRNEVIASVNALDTKLTSDLEDLETSIQADVLKADTDLLFLINKVKEELSNSVSDSVPVGSIFNYGGTAAPNNYLLCQGQILQSSEYPVLFQVIGTTYGTATAGTFKLPDLRSKVPVGSNGEDYVLGETGGSKEHTLTLEQMPSHQHTIPEHTHTVTDEGHSHGIYASPWNYSGDSGGGETDCLAHRYATEDSRVASFGGSLGIALELEGNNDTRIDYINRTIPPANYLDYVITPDFKFPDDPGAENRFNVNHVTEKTYIYSNYPRPTNLNPYPFIKVTPTDIEVDPKEEMTSSSTGLGTPHNNMQPFIVLNYIIKAR